MSRIALLLLPPLFFVFACEGSSVDAQKFPIDTPDALPSVVPEEYPAIYANLESQLVAFRATLDARWDQTESGTVFGANLLAANGHRGEALLSPE